VTCKPDFAFQSAGLQPDKKTQDKQLKTNNSFFMK